MNKRGMMPVALIYTFYIAVGFVLLIILYNGAKSAATSEYLQQSYESKDIGLIMDSLASSPAEVKLHYRVTPGFSYKKEKNRIDVIKGQMPNSFTYAESAEHQIQIEKGEGELVLVKNE